MPSTVHLNLSHTMEDGANMWDYWADRLLLRNDMDFDVAGFVKQIKINKSADILLDAYCKLYNLTQVLFNANDSYQILDKFVSS